MTAKIPSIIKEDEVVLFIDGETKVINDGHMNYDKIRAALKAEQFDTVLGLIDVSASIQDFGEGKVTVQGGLVIYNGHAVHNMLTDRIIKMNTEGFSITPMVAFMNNLMDNPSKRAVDELYGFMEKTDLPITDDGHLIAYKMVRHDYTDNHTGKMDNSVGAIPEMPRNEVDDDKESTCSDGLHFCSQNYLGFYGTGRTMILKINPRDVVSIPVDYKDSKGRACRYEIIGELETQPTKEHSFGASVYDGDGQTDTGEDLITILEAARRLNLTVDQVGEHMDDGSFDTEISSGRDGELIIWYQDSPSGGYSDLDQTVNVTGATVDMAGDRILSLQEAADELCGDAVKPMAALRKRISRGSVQTRWIGNEEKVVIPRS